MLGRPVVAELVRRGHDVRVLSRNPPRRTGGRRDRPPPAARRARGQTVTLAVQT
ncbi:MAG: hypothetical protein QOH83_2228 [Solirubrobacteraceae bacterium]|jgi:uncharacterized protein YbjT (DUF2867 family)|nr:hypothetical protein [Solirubrobacteraceae bacterium]